MDDDRPMAEWGGVERDGFRIRWSPVQLWVETYERSLVVTDDPTYGDVRRLCEAMRIALQKG